MPTPCYISITGQTQGNITAGAFTADSVGNIYVQGHEDEMLCRSFCITLLFQPIRSLVSLPGSVLTNRSFSPWR